MLPNFIDYVDGKISEGEFTRQLGLGILKIINPLTGKDRWNVLIVDDSLFSRFCSKNVELLAKVIVFSACFKRQHLRLTDFGYATK